MTLRGLILFWFTMLSVMSWAQPFPVKGRVLAADGPVPYATVRLVDGQQGTAADESGAFQLSVNTQRNYLLEVSAIGFKTKQVSIRIPGIADPLIIRLEEDQQALDDIVVTGTMREVGKLQSPIPVEVYGNTLFRKNPTPSIFEGLSLINGVQPQLNCNVCGAGDIRINGLDGPYTMVLIDGMPIVSSLSTVYGLSGIPNSLVKRIEVVKGPASTLYGSEAVGGVINIITRDPDDASRFYADVFATSIGEVNMDAGAVLKSGKASSLLGINYFQFTNARDINSDNFADAALQQRVSLFNKWQYPHRSGRTGSVAGRLIYEDRWGGELSWTKNLRGSDQVYGESVYTRRLELIGTQPLTQSQNLSFDYSINHHDQDAYYGLQQYIGRQQTAFTQMRWLKTAGKHELLTGLAYRYIFYDDNTPGTSSEQLTNKPSLTHLPGLFFQDEIRWHSSFTTLLGMRADHHNVHGNIFSPRISLKYAPGKNQVFRLTGGNGFRVVNLFTEDHAALTGARQVVIREALRPEESWNVNANYMHTIPMREGFISLDVSAFYTHFTNRIVGDFLTDPDKIIYDNLRGYSVSRGVTLNADLNLNSGFKMMTGITLMDVYLYEESAGERMPQLFAPRFSGTGSLSYATPDHRWAVDLTARVQGPMPMPVLPDDFRPAYSPWVPLLNLQLTRHLHTARIDWEFYGGIKNLLNFIPLNPLMRPFDPFDRNIDVDNPNGYSFDTAYSYAPVQGLKGFLGIRFNLK